MTYRPGLLSVVSATQTSLIRPDGTQVVLDTSNVPISGLTDAATLPSSTALGPMKLHGSLGGVDYFVTLSTAINSQTTPINALNPASSLAGGDKFPLYSAAGNAVMSCTFSQLVAAVQAAIGGGSSATAPSQVGSLAAGTPTSTTIPITYTAATGTAPITYAASTAPHGGSTFTANSATFGATGGTLTGLTAATNYDVRIVATNSAGSSTTTLLTGITTAAASAAGPSMTFNPADSYVTTGQKFGTGALSGGKGTLQFTVPQFPGSSVATMGVADLEFWFKAAGTTSFTGNAAFIKMVDSAGTEWGLKFGGQNFTSTYGAGDYATGNIRDGSWHHIRMNVRSDYNQQNYIEVLVDGGAKQPIKYDATPGIKTGTATLTIDFANAAAGDLIDEVWITSDSRQTVPSAAGVRDSATLVLLHLDGSGAGS